MRYLILFILLVSKLVVHAQVFDTFKIHFATNVYALAPAQKDSLDVFIDAMLRDSNKNMLVYGLSDYIGNSTQNQILSDRRAKVVANYLTSKRINAQRLLVVKGLGQSSNKNELESFGNSENRHTMILVPNRTTLPVVPKPLKTVTTSIPHHVALNTLVSQTEVKQTFVLSDIHFVKHKVELMPSSRPRLLELLHIMEANPQLKIAIEGHICCNKAEGYDVNSAPYKLSIARAKVVYDFLVNNKIPQERLAYAGFGRSNPIYEEEDTDEKINANKRVEIRILAK